MPERDDSHLPLGREPGPQSLRAAPDDGDDDGGTGVLLPLMAILFLACFIAIPLVVISVTDAQGVIYAVLGALAVVFIVAMWLLARRFRSGGTVEYEVLAEPLELRRGDEVEAELVVYEPDRLGRLEVGIVCTELYDRPARDGGGHPDAREVAEDIAYERWLPARRTEEEQRFRFRIPPEGPYSHEGECLSFAWRVSARDADGEESQADDPIWVRP
jgi:hypothetical protein